MTLFYTRRLAFGHSRVRVELILLHGSKRVTRIWNINFDLAQDSTFILDFMVVSTIEVTKVRT